MKDNIDLEYIPGHCNIGPEEIKRRLRMGYIGLVMIIAFIIFMEVFHLPNIYKLALFIPSAWALSGFLQARQRFCFLFGFYGLISFTGKRHKIHDDDQRQKDRTKAYWLILQVFSGSSLATFLYYFFS